MANEKRLIDLDKAFEAINQEVWWTESEKAYFRSFLVKQPKVDAVEVVRCNKCRYYNPESEYCGFWGACRHPEHYCGEGDLECGK